MSSGATTSLTALVEALRALAVAGDLASLTAAVASQARRVVGADAACVVLREGEECHCAAEDAVAPRWRGRRAPMSACIAGRVMLRDEPALIEDLDAELSPPGPADGTASVKGVAVVPVRAGEPIAALAACWARRHRATAEEVALLQAVADAAAVALRNVELAHALQEALRREQAERERAEQQAREAEQARAAVRRADAASVAKDRFLATLAHELRNPLDAIVNAAALLARREGPDPAATRASTLIRRQADHLARLLDDLLDLARISRDRVELRLEPLDLRTVVDLAVETHRPRLEAKRQELAVALPADPVPVLGDPARLRQVVGNLLDNASKYTPTGGAVSVSLVTEAQAAVVRIRDTGLGIEAGQLPRIFEAFTQLGPGPGPTPGGLGLGLAIVARLLALHGGAIEARSEGPGTGAEFVVRLPLARVAATAAAPATGPAPRASPAAARRILVVEDNDDAREIMAEALRLEGHEVWQARTGREALDVAHEAKPEVVVIDIGLPDIDGYEVARLLRRTAGARVRLIALTGYGQPQDRLRSTEAGFDAHLLKPVTAEDLLRLLDAR